MAGRKSAPVVASPPADKGKGKASAAPLSSSTEEQDNDLLALADKITATAGSLAPGNHDIALANQAREVVKASFDRGELNDAFFFLFFEQLLSRRSLALEQHDIGSTRLPQLFVYRYFKRYDIEGNKGRMAELMPNYLF